MKHKHWRVAHTLFDATDANGACYRAEDGRYYIWDEEKETWLLKNKRKPCDFQIPFTSLDIRVREDYKFDNLEDFLDFRDAVIRKELTSRVAKLNIRPPGGVLLVSGVGPREVSFATERMKRGSGYVKRYFARYDIEVGLAFMKQSRLEVYDLVRKDIDLPPSWYEVPPRWCPELFAW